MIGSASNALLSVAGIGLALLGSGCGAAPSLPAAVPTFHEITRGPGGIRTGYRVDEEGASWQFHNHDDELDESWCGDLAVAPDGRMRYLAFLHRTPPGPWILSVRTGLGPSTWSTEFSSVEVPSVNAFSCQPVRIQHLQESLYAIVWMSEGQLYNALFNSAGSPPTDLTLGEPRNVAGLGGDGMGGWTLTWWNDRVQLIWSAANGDRIQTASGSITDAGIDFDELSTFTPVSHSALSDALTYEQAIYLAARDDDNVRLLRTTIGGTGWDEIYSCPSPATSISGKLLYADQDGEFWVAERNASSDRLRKFSTCETKVVPVPISIGRMYYHPGS